RPHPWFICLKEESTMTITSRFIFFFCLALGAIGMPAMAQDYPGKPIHLIVPVSPGGLPDTAARIVTPEMAKPLGQSVIVENRAGADHLVAYEYVAKQAGADGYTIAIVLVPGLAILPV